MAFFSAYPYCGIAFDTLIRVGFFCLEPSSRFLNTAENRQCPLLVCTSSCNFSGVNPCELQQALIILNYVLFKPNFVLHCLSFTSDPPDFAFILHPLSQTTWIPELLLKEFFSVFCLVTTSLRTSGSLSRSRYSSSTATML